jgi:hypothetical protein
MVRAIPAEIVEIFLEHVIHGDGERGTNICNLLCVSATWRDIGIRLLWSDIVVDCDKLARFVQAPPSSNFSLITSFTFTSEPPQETDDDKEADPAGNTFDPARNTFVGFYRHPDVNKACRQLNSTLKELASILPLMIRLKTFSFYIHCQDILRRSPSTKISRLALRVVVNALPKSVESLEIDTKWCDQALDGEFDEHLCHAIAQRVPSLAHLRVRLESMCPKIIAASEALRSCIFFLQLPWMGFSTRHCSYSNVDVRRDLVRSISTTLLPSCHPKKLLVIDAVDPAGARLGRIDIRDLVNSSTTSCPLQTLRNRDVLVRFPQKANADETQDIAGSVGDIEELVEGQSWHTTMTGSRFPDDYRTSAMGAKHEWATNQKYATPDSWPAKLSDGAGVQSFKGHSQGWRAADGGPTTLWEDEAKAGRQLVEVRVVDGVGDTEPIVRLDQKEKDNSVILEEQAHPYRFHGSLF